jgi:hypothetical protein
VPRGQDICRVILLSGDAGSFQTFLRVCDHNFDVMVDPLDRSIELLSWKLGERVRHVTGLAAIKILALATITVYLLEGKNPR